jgi:hypothetical protein
MKSLIKVLAVLSLITASSLTLRAQDAPPPPDQGGPPPPDQGAPPPDQGAPPPDQGASSDQDDQGVSFQSFYDQLSEQGQWVQTDDYGYVFQPNVSDPNWAPYTDGHWVYSNVGWTWVSDEPWGWATYHYGRWANIDGTGWVWVPGYRWAPAWVSWRYGGGYAGWAPLPPGTLVGADYDDPGVDVSLGFHFGGDVDVSFGIGAGCYNFIRVGDFGYPNYRGRYENRYNNYAIINNTTNVTNININNRGDRGNFQGVSVRGPLLREVNASSRQRVPTVQLAESNRAGRSQLQGNTLSVFAPQVNGATIHQARPTRVSQTIAHPTFNRGDSITRPLAVTSTLRPAAPSADVVRAANNAMAHAPARAHIATANTPIRTQGTAPLTSLAPVAIRHNAAAVNGNTVQHNAVPSTGSQHRDAASAFTGENTTPATTHQASSVYHPPTGTPPTANHQQVQNDVHNEGQQTQVYHPSTQNQQTQVYHPQTQVYHPQAEASHTQTEVPRTQTQVYHPQAETTHAQTEVPHTQTQVFHPQAEVPHTQTEAPHTQTQVFHPQAQAQPQSHQAPAATHSAPAAAPAAQGQPATGNGQSHQQGH